MLNKKNGQIAETITWIVATVIIILILAASLLISSLSIGNKKDIGFVKTTDTLASKSLFSYLLTKDAEGIAIYGQLKNQENLNEFNGNLGKTIFEEFYGGEYVNVWLGIINTQSFKGEKNDYFGEKPADTKFENTKVESTSAKATELIKINNDKAIQVVLSHK